jgi:hypothetical protein
MLIDREIGTTPLARVILYIIESEDDRQGQKYVGDVC